VALVTFDANESIATDQVNDADPSQGVDLSKEALVTFDAGPPTSSVNTLPQDSPDQFTVSWSGQSDPGGSGIASYTIYVSTNGGAFAPWLTDTTQTSATYTGTNSDTYAFFSVATDNVGNVQPTPASAQATTTVETAPPITSASLSGTLGTSGTYTSPVTVTLTATDSYFPVADTYYSLDSGTTWLKYTAPFTVSSQGTTTVEYYSVDQAGNTETTNSANINIDSVAPDTTFQITGTVGSNGWYTSAVQVALSASDATSGVAATYYTINGGDEQTYSGSPFEVTADGLDQITFWSVDNAGNVEAAQTDSIQIDIATHLAVAAQPPSSVTAGSGFAMTIDVEDAGGSTDFAFDGNVTIALDSNLGNSNLGGTLTVKAINGVATFTGLTLNKDGTGYSLQATADGLPDVVSSSISVTSAAASQLAVIEQPPAKITTGAGIGLVVAAEDPFGNIAPSFNGKVTVALANNPSGARLGGAMSATAVDGIAVLDGPTLNKLGSGYTLKATTPGLTAVTTGGIDVVSVSDKVSVKRGSAQSATVGTTFATAPEVGVTGANGKPAASVPVTFTVVAGGTGGSFSVSGVPTTVTVNTSSTGLAIAPALTAGTTAGSYFVSVAVQGVVVAALFSETNRSGAPASLTVTAGADQTATVGKAFAHAFQVVVRDQYGNVVPGATVTFTAPGAGATGTFAGARPQAHVTVKTNSAGVATAPAFTAGKLAGSYSVTASVGTLKASSSEANVPGTPAIITVKEGSGQKTTVGTAFTDPLAVTVTDAFGNLLADVQVTFTAPGKGPSATFATTGSSADVVVSTNADGMAAATTMIANSIAGKFIVTASIAGVKKSVSFDETNED
jgi:hypothetical protein